MRGELQRAFAAYLGTLYAVVAELRELPAIRPRRRIDDWIERLTAALFGEAAIWVLTRRRMQATFGDRPQERIDRLAVSVAQVQVLPMPAEVQTAFNLANDYADRLARERTPNIKAEWTEIHKHLMAAAKVLGSS